MTNTTRARRSQKPPIPPSTKAAAAERRIPDWKLSEKSRAMDRYSDIFRFGFDAVYKRAKKETGGAILLFESNSEFFALHEDAKAVGDAIGVVLRNNPFKPWEPMSIVINRDRFSINVRRLISSGYRVACIAPRAYMEGRQTIPTEDRGPHKAMRPAGRRTK